LSRISEYKFEILSLKLLARERERERERDYARMSRKTAILYYDMLFQ
jgi:hypothetical protein